MLVAAAVCPQTPLLVPEVAGGAADELAEVRKASLDAVTRLRGAKPDLLLVLAAAAGAGAREARLGGTFRQLGVDLVVGSSTDRVGSADRECEDASADGCTGLLVGSWLLDAVFASAEVRREAWEIGQETTPEACASLGREFARRSERAALLVMADGSARRTLKAPGYLDDRAEPFDDEIARALAAADTAALAAVEPTVASALMAAGRAPWQVLAGAAAQAASSGAAPRQWRGELLCYGAPYGVGYFTALWTLDHSAAADA